MNTVRFLIIILFLHAALQFSVSQSGGGNARAHRTPVPLAPLNDPAAARWADSVMATLSTRERIAQMISAFTYTSLEENSVEALKRLVYIEKIGGVIISKGALHEAKLLTEQIQRWSSVPVLVSADFEYGLTMRLEGATEFPSAMALGATRSTDLAFAMGYAVGQEARLVGVHQNYAPVSDVNNNPANPVINIRSFGERPRMVGSMAAALGRGMQEAGLIATAKHFPGHGDTDIDSHTSLPSILKVRTELDSLELAPFRMLIDAGIMSVMTAHLAVPAVSGDSTVPATFSPRAIDTVLKRELGFSGLVVSDALNMGAIVNTYGSVEAVRRTIEAGVDVLLIPVNIPRALDSLTYWAERGELSMESVNESVLKILKFKYWAMHTNPRLEAGINSPEHKTLALSIARKAVTLVRNEAVLPFGNDDTARTEAVMLLHGRGVTAAQRFMDEVRERVPVDRTFMAERSLKSRDADGIVESLIDADRIIVASFAGVRYLGDPAGISTQQRNLLKKIEELNKPVVFLALQSPYVLNAMPSAKAMLCTYDDSGPSLQAAAEAIAGQILPSGELPVTVPGVARYGTGLSYSVVVAKAYAQVSDDVDSGPPAHVFGGAEAVRGMPPVDTTGSRSPRPLTSEEAREVDPDVPEDDPAFGKVDALIKEKIGERAFPGAQLAVGSGGGIRYYNNYGRLTYSADAPDVSGETMYDIASLTKVVATTTAIMKLYEQGLVDLNDPVVQFIPEFGNGGKRDVKIRHLLTHTGGLPPFKQYWRKYDNAEDVLEDIYNLPLEYEPGTKMVYSDLGFITLGKVVEAVTHTPLDRYLQREFFGPLGMEHTMFTPPARLVYMIAPTEEDDSWRKRLVHGTVHDENAALLDGVAGHAGLFSAAKDLSRFVRMLMNGGTLGGRRYLKESTIRQFTQAQPGAKGRALGWDTRSPAGSSSGKYFSPGSYGHTGFTGTSIWIDPKDDVFVVFLTNRVHPTRENKALPRFRSTLHDAVREALEKK